MTHREWLFSLTNHERRMPEKYTGREFSTDRYSALLARLGDPHLQSPPTVHILGTDGKGSTLAFLESLLAACGKTTCSFISPHLVSVEERFRENGNSVSEEALDSCLGKVRVLCGDLPEITFFEVLNAAFWLWAIEVNPDYVLLETGLGGRLDTTRICKPTLKILTHVDRDHVRLLGRTVDRIAWEKLSGLSTESSTVVARQSPFLEQQVDTFLRTQGIAAVMAEDRHPLEVVSRAPTKWVFRDVDGVEFHSNLIGDHQRWNLAAALTAFETLGLALPSGGINLEPKWLGRCQWVEQGSRTWVLDGSHTSLSGQALRTTLDQIEPNGSPPRTFWVACSSDRFPWCYLRGLVRERDSLHLVNVDHPRLWEPQSLRTALLDAGWAKYPLPTITVTNASEMYLSTIPGLHVVCGSLYWVGEVLRKLPPLAVD